MSYSDAEKAEALIRLARNGYNFGETAKQLGLPVMTLRRWNKNVPKKSVVALLNRAVEMLLSNVPNNFSGTEWSITVGILLDKLLLFQGQATSRSETITRKLGGLTDYEIEDILAEADRILAETESGGSTQGPGED